ncbi:TPA: helix-turn-helix domain-containing protein [Bacillus cereus]
MGLTIIDTTKKGRNAYIDAQNQLFLDCRTCNSIKPETKFSNKKGGFKGKNTNCRDCSNSRVKKWYAKSENKKKAIERATKWNRSNPRKPKIRVAELKKISMERYERQLYTNHILRIKRRNMVNDFTEEEYIKVMKTYNHRCCLTGTNEKLTLDHVIPLATGHGGTTYTNMLPLSLSLNSSKQARNIFQWAELNHSRLGFTMERFNEVMTEVATRNEMTLEDYKEYYFWCFDNPKEIPTDYSESNYYITFQNRLNDAIEMYIDGATKQEIVESTKISESTLYKYLNLLNIEKRKPSLHTLEDRLNDAINMYKSGEKLKTIYKKTKIHKKTLYSKIRELGVQTRFPDREENGSIRLKEAVEMYIQGKGVESILKEVRIGKKTLYDALDNLKIPRRR